DSGGSPPRDTHATRLYHINTNTWTAGAAAPLPNRAEVGSTVKKGLFYVVGGRSATVLSDLDRYNPTTDTWAGLAPMPTPRAGVVLNAAEVYDPTTNTWSAIAPLPTGAAAFYGLAKSKLEGPEVYVVGGLGVGFSTLGTTQVYKVASNTYDPGEPAMLTPRGE